MSNALFKFLQESKTEERTSFRKYLKSEYFGSSKKFINIYLQAIKLLRRIKIEEKDVIKVIEKHTTGKSGLRNFNTDLISHLRLFDAVEYLRADKENVTEAIRRKHKETGKYDDFCKNTAKLFKVTDTLSGKGAEEYFQLYELSHDFLFHSQTRTLKQSQTALSAISKSGDKRQALDYCSEQLEHFYYTKKLFLILERRARIFAGFAEEELAGTTSVLQETAKKYEGKKGVWEPLIALLDLFVAEKIEPEDILRVVEKLEKNQAAISARENLIIGQKLTFFSNRQGTEKNSLLYAIYDYLDRSDALLIKGKIHHDVFINFANTFTLNQKFERVEAFIKKRKKHLLEKERRNAVNIAEAFKFFHEKNFKSCAQKLKKIEEKDAFSLEFVLTLSVRCEYEFLTNNPAEFIKCNDRLRKHSQSRVYYNADKRAEFRRFCNKIMVLANAKMPGGTDLEHLQKIKTSVEEAPKIFAKPWLLEKIRELELRYGNSSGSIQGSP